MGIPGAGFCEDAEADAQTNGLSFDTPPLTVARVDRHKIRRKTAGGVLVFVGYMLSPLSWWNDAFVNLPLALAFAWVVALFYKPAFGPSVVLGYWLTNVLGFVLMHKGGAKIISENEQPWSRKSLIWDILISFAYTALIVILVKYKVLQPITDYFPK
jgi:hypothetical protein